MVITLIFLLTRSTLIQDSDNIEATNILVLHSLCRIGDYTQAVDNLGELILRIDKNEPKNAALYYNCALTFSRLVSFIIRIRIKQMSRYTIKV